MQDVERACQPVDQERGNGDHDHRHRIDVADRLTLHSGLGNEEDQRTGDECNDRGNCVEEPDRFLNQGGTVFSASRISTSASRNP